MRAKYQVLVLPYKKDESGILYCIFERSDMNCWQFIAGGGEADDDLLLTSAKREALEEANISFEAKYTELESKSSIATEHFPARSMWGKDCIVIPEHAFAVEAGLENIRLSDEHNKFEWVDYNTAMERLKYDSNRTALWELDQKLKIGIIR